MNYQDLDGSYFANFLIRFDEELDQCPSPILLFGTIDKILATTTDLISRGKTEDEPNVAFGLKYKSPTEYAISGSSLYLLDKFLDNVIRWAFSNNGREVNRIRDMQRRLRDMIEVDEVLFDTDVHFKLKSLDATSFSLEISTTFMGSVIWSEKTHLVC